MQHEQSDKLARLVKLNVITEDEATEFTDPRTALKIIGQDDVLEGWEDMGRIYNLTFRNRKPISVRPKQVWEAIADRILEVKDPIRETIEEEISEEKEVEEESTQEGEVALPPYAPTDYSKLSSEQLTNILKDRGLPFTGTIPVKIERLEEADK